MILQLADTQNGPIECFARTDTDLTTLPGLSGELYAYAHAWQNKSVRLESRCDPILRRHHRLCSPDLCVVLVSG